MGVARKPKQLELPTPATWGGARKGAGRKRVAARPCVPHRARAELDRRHPVHATLRVTEAVGNLRTKTKVCVIRNVMRQMHSTAEPGQRLPFQIVHFSVQSTHVHLIVEADDKAALARGLKAFEIRVAKRLNVIAERKGRVFSDRYHAHALRTPRETRRALAYVLLNARHHTSARARAENAVDPCSSGALFNGWSRPPELGDSIDDVPGPPTKTARTWLLTTGWRAKGELISPDEVPGAH